MNDPATIKSYHAHVYYDGDESRARAADLRAAIEEKFDVTMGRWRDEPVGPHPRAMYQVAFEPDQFATLVPWLMLNRNGLTILLHPNTGDAVADHRDQPFWFGEVLPLDIAFLESLADSA